jgi:hypothetical protein
MFPHPNTVADVRTLQNRDLLRNAPSPSWIEMGSASMCRLLAAMSASAATSLFTRPLARAWR